MLTPAADQNGSQVNFYYGAPTPYAESIAPSHHSTYAHYYDDEEDGWEMPNFYNETYMKGIFVENINFQQGLKKKKKKNNILHFIESLHNGGKMNSLARSNASIYGTKEDLYDRLKRHAYPGKKGGFHLFEKSSEIERNLRKLFLFQTKATVTVRVNDELSHERQ